MQQQHQPSRLVPLGVLASDLGIQAKALREAAERGEIPHVRVGERGLLFDRLAVERALLARAADADPDARATRQEDRDAAPE